MLGKALVQQRLYRCSALAWLSKLSFLWQVLFVDICGRSTPIFKIVDGAKGFYCSKHKKNNLLLFLYFSYWNPIGPPSRDPPQSRTSKLNGNVSVVTATLKVLLEWTRKTAVVDLATSTLLHGPCKAMSCNHCTASAKMFQENSTTDHMFFFMCVFDVTFSSRYSPAKVTKGRIFLPVWCRETWTLQILGKYVFSELDLYQLILPKTLDNRF